MSKRTDPFSVIRCGNADDAYLAKGRRGGMKILFVAVIAAAFCGCYESPRAKDGSYLPCEDGIYRTIKHGRLYVIKIDGHEYIVRRDGDMGGICHSASCPCHREKSGAK